MNRPTAWSRLNLVDVTAVVFLLGLVPVGYATYLLFRPSQPQIESVTPAVITREERRISAGSRLVAKFKVRGTGFTPLLRARIDETDALGFVFESPNSADLLVGPIAPGPHDLVLYDGVQEVARATGAIVVERENPAHVRAAGWLLSLDDALLKVLEVGLAFPASEPSFEILALGPPRPARSTIRIGGAVTDIPVANLFEREAVLTLRCEPSLDDNPCATTQRPDSPVVPVVVGLAGPTRPFEFAIAELFPSAPPRRATATVVLGPDAPVSLIRTGDRDHLLDERAAVITRIDRQGSLTRLSVTLGLDPGRDGWQYRGQTMRPGAPLRLGTERFDASGTVASVELVPQ